MHEQIVNKTAINSHKNSTVLHRFAFSFHISRCLCLTSFSICMQFKDFLSTVNTLIPLAVWLGEEFRRPTLWIAKVSLSIDGIIPTIFYEEVLDVVGTGYAEHNRTTDASAGTLLSGGCVSVAISS